MTEKKRAPKAAGPSDLPDVPMGRPEWDLFSDSEIAAMSEVEAKEWVRKLDWQAGQRDRLLKAVPECPEHGPCIPHALAWIESAKGERGDEPLPVISVDDWTTAEMRSITGPVRFQLTIHCGSCFEFVETTGLVEEATQAIPVECANCGWTSTIAVASDRPVSP